MPRRPSPAAACILPALLVLAAPPPALAQDRILSHCISLAQGPATGPRILPASFGEGVEPDAVRIHFIGHASFAISPKNTGSRFIPWFAMTTLV